MWVKLYKQGEYAIINRKIERCDCISPYQNYRVKSGLKNGMCTKKKKVGPIIETSQTHGAFALFVQFYPISIDV